jgi:uncharacterized membrane protein
VRSIFLNCRLLLATFFLREVRMTTRLALFDLIARNNMDASQASRLWRLAGLDGMPSGVPARIRLGLTMAGAGCTGLGLIFWVAANWSLLSRFGQFALLQTLVLAPCAGLAAYGRGRAALGLLALAATGGLFACFGQTYQTGADPWQLFAVWASLALPLACLARADTVWAAWALIVLVAIGLCEHAYTEYVSYYHPGQAAMAAAAGALGLTVFLRTIARRRLGAGQWAFGLAVLVTAVWITTDGVRSLTSSMPDYGYYLFSVAVGGLTAAALAHARPFDVFPSSTVALCLNILLVAGLANLLFKGSPRDWIVPLLILGLAAASLLAGSVKLIVGLTRADALQNEREAA